MLKHLVAALVVFTTVMVGLVLTAGSSVPVDMLLGRIYWPPITSLTDLPNVFAPIISMFPVLTLLPFIFMLAVGILCLMEMD